MPSAGGEKKRIAFVPSIPVNHEQSLHRIATNQETISVHTRRHNFDSTLGKQEPNADGEIWSK
jgi:hypothetical protein